MLLLSLLLFYWKSAAISLHSSSAELTSASSASLSFQVILYCSRQSSQSCVNGLESRSWKEKDSWTERKWLRRKWQCISEKQGNDTRLGSHDRSTLRCMNQKKWLQYSTRTFTNKKKKNENKKKNKIVALFLKFSILMLKNNSIIKIVILIINKIASHIYIYITLHW